MKQKIVVIVNIANRENSRKKVIGNSRKKILYWLLLSLIIIIIEIEKKQIFWTNYIEEVYIKSVPKPTPPIGVKRLNVINSNPAAQNRLHSVCETST